MLSDCLTLWKLISYHLSIVHHPTPIWLRVLLQSKIARAINHNVPRPPDTDYAKQLIYTLSRLYLDAGVWIKWHMRRNLHMRAHVNGRSNCGARHDVSGTKRGRTIDMYISQRQENQLRSIIHTWTPSIVVWFMSVAHSIVFLFELSWLSIFRILEVPPSSPT